ncbi:hypothetical protein [Dysgonomonas termitidis]|uniref:Uncharacterized protein n=1 Tax=Dysgonomonas termitidis TaxID=1516126 RepID=A0ABV9KV40_9BACT
MEEKDKDNIFIFKPQIGLGKVLFSFNKEEDILKILGTSAERSIDIFSKEEFAIYLDYWNLSIFVSLYFENSFFDRLSIHTQNIILDNFCFSHHNQSEILSFIREYHNTYKLDFIEKIEFDKNTEETWYFYENLGLTIWFDKNGISDICVQKTRSRRRPV